MDTVKISDIRIKDRQRKDFGDIDALAKSIKDVGLIQPIVLAFEWEKKDENLDVEIIRLIAGHRRLLALQKLGWTEVQHVEHYIWRSEYNGDSPDKVYLRSAAELEENLRRKSLTWVEEVQAKAELLKLYQSIYGAPSGGRPTGAQTHGNAQKGFGVRKLSELLGESAAQTSEDLEMAALVSQIPALQKEESREAARRKLNLAVQTALGQNSPRVVAPLIYKIIITCDSEQQQRDLLEQLRKAGLKCQPLVA
jgi:hypothetical protein